MPETEVGFHTGRGNRLSGVLHVPRQSGMRYPAVVLCQGLSGVQHLVLPHVAEVFGQRGFASLRFDYTGYGASEGERGWIDPRSRVDDALSAAAWLGAQRGIDARRLGAYGHSYGGPIALALAARDPRIRAVVSVSGPGDGATMLAGLRTADEFEAFMRLVAEERAQISITGKRRRVRVEEIMPFSPAFQAQYAALKTGGTSAIEAHGTDTFWLASVDAMVDFHPEEAVRRLTSCPVLLVHGDKDDVVPPPSIDTLYRSIPGRKELVIVPDAGHNDLDTGNGLELACQRAAHWFAKHLASLE
jgi:uncharacterized protein